MTHQNLLTLIGKALYGDQWQSDMARALDINPRTVRYWVAKGEVPASVWPELEQLCLDRMPKLLEAIASIKALRP